MKQLLCSTLLLALACTSNAQTTYPSGVTGCIARWDFASGGGTLSTLPDVSGNSNTGTPSNINAGQGWRGAANSSGNFNGTNSIAVVPSTTLLGPSAVTIVALVKPYGFYSGTCQDNNILFKGSSYFTTGCYAMRIDDNDGNCSTFSPSTEILEYAGSATTSGSVTGPIISTGNWYFLVTSFNGSSIKRYTIPMSPFTHALNITNNSSSSLSSATGTNTDNVKIGATQNPTYPYWFNGDMDEVILFNKALTDAEVQSVYDYLWAGAYINTPAVDTLLCPNAVFNVNYTVTNSTVFQPGNSFDVQLSNSSGSFASPTTIGTSLSTTSGSISCTIPSTTPMGMGYRIRLVSNIPAITSPVDSINIQINTVAPQVTTTVLPGTTLYIGMSATFTAAPIYGGTTPIYQWFKNLTPISGANAATYNAVVGADFVDGDSIYVRMISNFPCRSADTAFSNKQKMYVLSGIASLNDNNYFSIYPNPNRGNFTLQGDVPSTENIQLTVTNAIGQVVYTNNISPINKKVNEHIDLTSCANGIYILHLKNETGDKALRITVNK
ncbi:MAG: T9SS type A sorting domain-containing protein [Bacteroidetes bacterium]|nr:T9SS type A sorting domain-containing protein [Bacteroidota bacterium]